MIASDRIDSSGARVIVVDGYADPRCYQGRIIGALSGLIFFQGPCCGSIKEADAAVVRAWLKKTHTTPTAQKEAVK